MGFQTTLTTIAAIAAITGVIIGLIQYVRSQPGKEVAKSFGITFAIVLVILLIARLIPPPQTSASGSNPTSSQDQGNSPSVTNSTLTQAQPTQPLTTNPPAPGTILCQFDATHGWNGWSGSSDWEVYNGELLSNGQTPSTVTIPTIVAPCQFSTSDYAVEAQIRMNSGELIFGIEARGTTTANGLHNYSVYNETYGGNNIDIGGDFGSIVKTPWTPNTNWHTYRFELKGINLTLFVDGAQILQTTDYRYLTGWQTGLASAGTQLEVASFEVIAL